MRFRAASQHCVEPPRQPRALHRWGGLAFALALAPALIIGPAQATLSPDATPPEADRRRHRGPSRQPRLRPAKAFP